MGLGDHPWPLLPAEDAQWFQGVAGEPILAGQVCYWHRWERRLFLAQSDSWPAEAVPRGLALNSALVAGQAMRVLTTGGGIITQGPAPPVFITGLPYVLGDAPGSLVSVLDQPPGTKTSVIGVGGERNRLLVYLFASGVPLV